MVIIYISSEMDGLPFGDRYGDGEWAGTISFEYGNFEDIDIKFMKGVNYTIPFIDDYDNIYGKNTPEPNLYARNISDVKDIESGNWIMRFTKKDGKVTSFQAVRYDELDAAYLIPLFEYIGSFVRPT